MLKTRIITALILAPIVIGGLFFLPPAGFAWFTGLIIAIGGWEWANMSGLTHPVARLVYAVLIAVLLVLALRMTVLPVLLAALVWWLVALALIVGYPQRQALFEPRAVRAIMGVFVLVPAGVGLDFLRAGEFRFGALDNNLLLILYVFCVVWVADIGAYFAGRAFGKSKLAPHVSPGKSWAGVWGGLAAVALFAALVGLAADASLFQSLLLMLVSIITASISVVGDLFESLLKRFRGIKDSSQLLPGHGGVMDRIDSLTAAVPAFPLFALLLGWFQVAA